MMQSVYTLYGIMAAAVFVSGLYGMYSGATFFERERQKPIEDTANGTVWGINMFLTILCLFVALGGFSLMLEFFSAAFFHTPIRMTAIAA